MKNWKHIKKIKGHHLYRLSNGSSKLSKFYEQYNAENNARLIAASPQMLEVLKALDFRWTEIISGGPDAIPPGYKVDQHKAIWQQLRAVINNAEQGE